VPHLLELLPKRPPDSPYIVWLDNLFSSTKLFGYLRQQGFGATGTARSNSGICADFATKKQADQKKDNIPWGTLYSEPTIGNDINQLAWKDNALVLFLSTTHETGQDQVVIRHRKRPALTSTSAKTARKAFGSEPEKDLPIPKFIDDYNHYMGGPITGFKSRLTTD
jgi:Transposase IS4